MMSKDLFIATCLCLCLSPVSGFYVQLNSIVPTATPTALISHQDTVVPEPTIDPGDNELRRRQTAQVTQRSVLEAPDNTCGYFGGNSGWFQTVDIEQVFLT
jgi:DNA/RNA endonuclease YhcR with UshA esterase domain